LAILPLLSLQGASLLRVSFLGFSPQEKDGRFGPLGLVLGQAAECFWKEGWVGGVKGDGHAAAVGTLVAAMAIAFALAPCEAIGENGAYCLGGR